jgi:hypothetical protein
MGFSPRSGEIFFDPSDDMIRKHGHTQLGSELTEDSDKVFLWNESRITDQRELIYKGVAISGL